MAKTNSGLVAYAKAQVGLPYWYGTYGQEATESLYNSQKKQYPSQYTATDFSSQYGKRVHDCSGLIKGYLWSDDATSKPVYKASQDKSASGMYSACSSKGKIADFPGKAGQLVFRGESVSGIHHVDVYGGDGYVYEAQGHSTGVLKSVYKASGWNYWGQHPDIEDDADTDTGASTGDATTGSAASTSTSSSASSSSSTSALTVDGEIGSKTVTRLQAVLGTTQDGKIDGQSSTYKKYWTAILDSVCGWTGGSSQVVKAIQKLIGVTQDGILGPTTAKRLQTYLIGEGYSCGSTGSDGYFGANSAKASQRWLNAQ